MIAIRLETIRDLFDIKGMTKEMLRAVLTHPNIAIVDREAETPFPMCTIRMNDPRYQDGAMIHTQKLMLKEGWVKEILND